MELAIHDSADAPAVRRRAQWADHAGLPVVATCESRCLRREQALLLRALASIGTLTLLSLYALVLFYGMQIASSSRNQFGRYVAMGMCLILLLYVLINTAMVVGLIPVVGVPLPLVSYGGTAIMTIMFGMGLLMSVYVHRYVEMKRA